MAPREFLEGVVRPNVADVHANYADLRHAYNAVAALDALAAHIYVGLSEAGRPTVAGIRDDTYYQERLAQAEISFALLRDSAKAQKHAPLIVATSCRT